MMVNPLREAPNLTTKLATTAKCRTTSTASSAPAFLASPWTLGPTWTVTRTEAAFKNLLLNDLEAMIYYFGTNTYYKNAPVSLPRDPKDMATIFARLNLLV
jgi:hypothetical protein